MWFYRMVGCTTLAGVAGQVFKIRDATLPPSAAIFNTLRKLPTDPKQDLRPNLHLAAFHRREIVLADANAFSDYFSARAKSTIAV